MLNQDCFYFHTWTANKKINKLGLANTTADSKSEI